MLHVLQFWRPAILIAALLPLSGCYYWQAARGQIEIMARRQPISDLIASGELSPTVQERLELVSRARRFSVEVLRLPDNDTYRTYADLDRDFVVWNVVAAPEFSLQPKQWCFPVAGCVNYRGYFSRRSAQHYANALEEKGFDVAVGGVAAYSTLGRLGDPVLNTMLYQDDARLLAVVFHELAHQVVYIPGDTAFNEAFASAVEELGVTRWMQVEGREDLLATYQQHLAWRQRLHSFIGDTRGRLASLYAGNLGPAEKRRQKHLILDQLKQRADSEYRLYSGNSADWFQAKLNNAWLAAMALYQDYLPAFRALLEQCRGEVECFYREAQRLAALEPKIREQRLTELAAPEGPQTRQGSLSGWLSKVCVLPTPRLHSSPGKDLS